MCQLELTCACIGYYVHHPIGPGSARPRASARIVVCMYSARGHTVSPTLTWMLNSKSSGQINIYTTWTRRMWNTEVDVLMVADIDKLFIQSNLLPNLKMLCRSAGYRRSRSTGLWVGARCTTTVPPRNGYAPRARPGRTGAALRLTNRRAATTSWPV